MEYYKEYSINNFSNIELQPLHNDINEQDKLDINNMEKIELQNYYKNYSILSDISEPIEEKNIKPENIYNTEEEKNIKPENIYNTDEKNIINNSISNDVNNININKQKEETENNSINSDVNDVSDVTNININKQKEETLENNSINSDVTNIKEMLENKKNNQIKNILDYNNLLNENINIFKNILIELTNFKNIFDDVINKIKLFKITEFQYIIDNFTMMDDELDMDIDDTSTVLETNELWNNESNIVKLTCDGWKGYKVKAYTKSKKIPDKINELSLEFKKYYINLYNKCYETYINNFNNIDLENKLYLHIKKKFNLQ